MKQHETGRRNKMTNKILLTSPFSLFPKKLLTFLKLLTITFSLLTILTCSNMLSPPNNQPGPNPERGRVTVYFDGPGEGSLLPGPAASVLPGGATARTLMPANPTFAEYVITFTDTDMVKPDVTANNATSGQGVSLDAGTWTVRVDGYVGTVVAASGTAEDPITVTNGVNTDTTVTLTPLSMNGGDDGTFEWDIDVSAVSGNIDQAKIRLQPLSWGQSESIDLLSGLGYSGARNDISPGVYEVVIYVKKDAASGGKAATISTTAYIYPGLSTKAEYAIVDGQFVSQVMLAGTVAITKPSGLNLTGTITVRAYSDSARSTPNQIGIATVALPTFNGGTTGTSGEWVMAVPITDLPSATAYFTVSVGDGTYTYTAPAGDSGTIPDNGKDSLSLPLNIYTVTTSNITPLALGAGTLATNPSGLPAAAAGATLGFTASANTGYTMMTGFPKVYKTGDSSTPVTFAAGGSPGAYTFTMPGYDVTIEADIRSSAKEITEFYFTIGGNKYGAGTGAESGSGSIGTGTVSVTVPYGTDLTALPGPTVTHTGASITRLTSGTSFAFTVNYEVSALDATTQSYTVTVQAAGIASISVASGPTTTVYPTGAALNTTGLVIDGQDDLGTAVPGLSGWTCSSLDSTSRGSKTITVTASGKTTTFNVTVQNTINTLGSLGVSGYSFSPAFAAATGTYTVTIPYGTAGPLTLTAALTDTNASFATGSEPPLSIVINTSAAPGADCGSQTVTVQPEYTGGAAKTYTVTVKYGDGINVNGITNAGIPVITFSGVPSSVSPGTAITITTGETVTAWHITVDGPLSYTHTTAAFSAPAVNGFYTVNVIATINGIPYSGSFSLMVQ
jgi:hypothetical protein